MNIRVAKAGLRIDEVPSFESPRIHGVSNLNAFHDGLRVFRTILAERRHSRSLRARQEQVQQQELATEVAPGPQLAALAPAEESLDESVA